MYLLHFRSKKDQAIRTTMEGFVGRWVTESACRFIYNAGRYWFIRHYWCVGLSVGEDFVFVGDKFSDTLRRPLFLIFFFSTFLQRDFKGNVKFTTGNGHFPQEKQYFLSFVGFFCPQKSSKIVSRNVCLFRSQIAARLKNPL